MLRSRIGLLIVVATGALASSPAQGSQDALSSRLQILAEPALQDASRGDQARAVSLLSHGPGSLSRSGDDLVLEIRVNGDERARARALEARGARVLHVSRRYDAITAAAPEGKLRAIGVSPGVEYAQEVVQPASGAAASDGQGDSPDTPSGGGSINTCATGTVSEANTQLKADIAKTQFDVDGSGVEVGVLSDSFDKNTGAATHPAGDILSADLPGAANPCGRTSAVSVEVEGVTGADEGRAMLQAVHDVAPGAGLAFASASLSQSAFADNIHALRNAGADVIADDWIFFREPPYQDGIVADAINDVVADGAVYETMAYNSNRIFSGQNVNSWAAPAYRPMTCPAVLGAGGDCMDFDPGAGTDATFRVPVTIGSIMRMSLNWAEPMFGVTDDFDLYMLSDDETAVSLSSLDVNATSGSPNEFISTNIGAAGASRHFVIKRVSGTGTPPLSLTNLDNVATSFTGLPEWNSTNSTDTFGPTIIGHNGTSSAITVAAAPYNNSATIENFSARGPVTHYFQPVDGTTPSPAFGSPQVLAKPDVTATDAGANTFFGPVIGPVHRFFGTSQSAPHAAGVAALQLEANPALTPAQVKANQKSGAAAVGAFPATAAGSGLLQVPAAIAATPPAAPTVSLNAPAATKDRTPNVTVTTTGDVKTLTCKVDSGAAAPCTSPFTTPSLSDGNHTVTVTATDYFAHSGQAAKAIKVDATKPEVKFSKAPAKSTKSKQAKFKIKTEAGAQLTCKLDKEKAKSCSKSPKFTVGPGKHKLKVTATDAVGNAGKGTYSWKVK